MNKFFTKRSTYLFSALLATALMVSGCNSSSSDDETTQETPAETKSVAIAFEAVVGDETLECSDADGNAKTYTGIGTSGDTITMNDFRFFVSEVKMVRADGTTANVKLDHNDYQYQGESSHVALLDFEDKSGNCNQDGNTEGTHMVIEGNVSNETYTAVEITLGVPFDLNHHNELFADTKELTNLKLQWNWQKGQKFTKMESTSETTGQAWKFHLGSTDCTDTDDDTHVDECTQPNRVTIRLNDFNPSTDTIKIDYEALLAANDVSTDAGGAAGCMSKLVDPECKELMGQLGLDVEGAVGSCFNGGDCTLSQQGVFTKGTK